MREIIFSNTQGKLYESSDHAVVMQLLRCGIEPVKANLQGRRVSVFFLEKEALSTIARTVTEPDMLVRLADVTRADIAWKSILDALKRDE